MNNAESYLKNLPAEFQEILILWDDIKREFFEDDESGATAYQDALNTGSWSWKPVFSELPPDQIDRLDDVILGPVYTSEEHPWPESSGGPMIPLVQLNLDKASRTGSIDLGTGLLQVFAAIEDRLGQRIMIREIERNSVKKELLRPIPEFSDEVEGFASVNWAKKNPVHGESDLCIQIIGYEEKTFSLWSRSSFSENYDLSNIEPSLKAKLERFDSLIEEHSDKWSPGDFHLFGAFYPIQYYPDRFSRPLFCLESEHGFNFGDGQAQIFYRRKISAEFGERAFFNFRWSCY